MLVIRIFTIIALGLLVAMAPTLHSAIVHSRRRGLPATASSSERTPTRRAPDPTCRDHISQLVSQEPDLREKAAQSLARRPICDPRFAVPALAERLSDPDVNVRLAIDRALIAYGVRAAPAVPALITVLGEPETKEWAPLVLANIGEPAVPALTEALVDPRPHVRRSAAFALGAIGEPARPATRALMRLARSDRSWLVRRSARWALVSIDGKLPAPARPGEQILSEMIRGLNDVEDPDHAFTALVHEEKRAVPALKRALRSPSPRVRRDAARALDEIKKQAAE